MENKIILPSFDGEQQERLKKYVSLTWEKKGHLNLVSAESEREIWERHITDGLYGASLINSLAMCAEYSVADIGAGAGFIGITMAVALPKAKIALIESIEKRCYFMNWVILKLGLKNAQVINKRAYEGDTLQFDFTVQRAMGKIEDVLGVCMAYTKPAGYFAAYQSEKQKFGKDLLAGVKARAPGYRAYTLPGEEKERYLAVFNKI